MEKETEPKTSIQVASLLGERTTPEELAAFMERYEKFKVKLLKDSDYAQIGDSKAIRKSGWYKLGVAFQISSLPTKIWKEWHNQEKNEFIYHVEVQCTAMNGRVCGDVGTCTNFDEKNPILKGAPEHVIKAMAVTRGSERALIKMLGAPDQGAEDVESNVKPENGNSKQNGEVCHCAFDKMNNNKGVCGNCGKPLTIKQIDALKQRVN